MLFQVYGNWEKNNVSVMGLKYNIQYYILNRTMYVYITLSHCLINYFLNKQNSSLIEVSVGTGYVLTSLTSIIYTRNVMHDEDNLMIFKYFW